MKADKRINGLEEACELLQGLDYDHSMRLIKQIGERNPRLADRLKDGLVSMESLLDLTPHMVMNLMKDISPEELGMALRGQDLKLRNFFMNNLPNMMKATVIEVLNGPRRKMSEVKDAEEHILKMVRKKIEKGEILIRKGGNQFVP